MNNETARNNARKNKAIIQQFYEEFFNQHRVECAKQYVKETYIQHNPGVAQGRAGFMEAFREKFLANPSFRLEIIQIIEEEDMAAVYLKNVTEDEQGNTRTNCRVVDLYRLESGMLAEHWDVIQTCCE